MIGAGIFDGDIVIVEKTPEAQNGDIVVALIEDEATVKTFYREDSHFRLQPENPEYEPIIIQDVTILGQVLASIRYHKNRGQLR
jgi:repressor LexA